MININVQIIFNAITILFHTAFQCAIKSEINIDITLSEITLNITIHGSNYNRLLRHFSHL